MSMSGMSGFGRRSVVLLSVEWIVFGSMHFSMLTDTVKMLPDWVPVSAQVPAAVVTGMLEVVTGILILLPATRRWAAMLTLGLLALYVFPVYHILAANVPLFGGPVFYTAFKVAVVPNNVLLGICAIYLWKNPDAAEPVFEATAVTDLPERITGQAGAGTLLVAILLLMANCAGFLAIFGGLHDNYSEACLWAMMCIAVGALIGFLFGVPRVNPNVAVHVYLLPNTNVETVSDWLTKIIVGVGLINFQTIGAFLEARAQNLSNDLKTGEPYALALIVYFFVVGVMQGYILTRMYLSWQFSLQDTVDPKGEETR